VGGEFVEKCVSCAVVFHDDYFKVGEVEVFHEGFELRDAGGVLRFSCCVVLCCVVLCCVVWIRIIWGILYMVNALITQSLNHSIGLKRVNGG
jgi:hypothetical protein